MAPIALAARARPAISHRLVATGQQDALFDRAISDFGVNVDQHLGHHPGTGDMTRQIDAMRAAISAMLGANRPDLVLVQGDTNSAYAAALAARDKGVAIGHVEAGLRSHVADLPWPEERNRCAIGQIATLHFAPSARAMDNLAGERVGGLALLTGNPGIDALMMTTRSFDAVPHSKATILVTCHRRENFGLPLFAICQALRTLAARGDVMILLPVHPNSRVRLTVTAALGSVPAIRLIDPLGYPEMIAAIRAARFVISDSGGLQEECAALGIPLILMRDQTERPEVIESENCVLTGADPTRIIAEATRLLDDPARHNQMSQPRFPYGQGDAAALILNAIEHLALS